MKEAYCSFETSKLLKKKGFDWDCITYYVDFESDDVKYSMLFENNTTWEERCYSAPTHQTACAWLREECEVYIDIETCYEYTDRNENFKVTGFAFTTHTKDDPCYDDDNSFDSYEEACEAALKHVLENLI